jgi:hypothetical protein
LNSIKKKLFIRARVVLYLDDFFGKRRNNECHQWIYQRRLIFHTL